jgi:hypothetical protein
VNVDTPDKRRVAPIGDQKNVTVMVLIDVLRQVPFAVDRDAIECLWRKRDRALEEHVGTIVRHRPRDCAPARPACFGLIVFRLDDACVAIAGVAVVVEPVLADRDARESAGLRVILKHLPRGARVAGGQITVAGEHQQATVGRSLNGTLVTPSFTMAPQGLIVVVGSKVPSLRVQIVWTVRVGHRTGHFGTRAQLGNKRRHAVSWLRRVSLIHIQVVGTRLRALALAIWRGR